MTAAAIWTSIAEQRRQLAELLDTLSAEQLATASLCEGWSVQDVFGHLCAPLAFSPLRAIADLALAGGSPHGANRRITARLGRRPPAAIAEQLRRGATVRFAPPLLGPAAPLTDVLVHGHDIRDPLGLPDPVPADRWIPSLGFLTGARALVGFTRRGRPSLTLRATDCYWSHGAGPEVAGPAAALGLALTGRPVPGGALDGPGAEPLARWSGTARPSAHPA